MFCVSGWRTLGNILGCFNIIINQQHTQIASIAESPKLKKADIACTVAITSYFHTQYAEFSKSLRPTITSISIPDDVSDKDVRACMTLMLCSVDITCFQAVASFRFQLRLLIELVVVAVLPINDCKHIYETLKKITMPKYAYLKYYTHST